MGPPTRRVTRSARVSDPANAPDRRSPSPGPIHSHSPNGSHWTITFTSPTPEGAEYLGRNHPLVAALARFLMEEALTKHGAATATRCGVIRTRAVSRLCTIMLLRIRYLLEQPGRPPLLSEEVLVAGATRSKEGKPDWLSDDDALRLLAEARPDANVPMSEKRQLIASVLESWPSVETALKERIHARAADLEKSHKRVRQAVSQKVRHLTLAPKFPPDLLGLLVLQPVAPIPSPPALRREGQRERG